VFIQERRFFNIRDNKITEESKIENKSDIREGKETKNINPINDILPPKMQNIKLKKLF